MATRSTKKPRKSVKKPPAPKAPPPEVTPPPEVEAEARPGYVRAGKKGWIRVGGEEE